MSARFYIDALDGLGGAAFGSLREGNLAIAEAAGDAPAWYIAAPDFRPRPVSSRAIGLAANRGGFQLGFSIDGETEVPFKSLEVLAEYVRRLFISGGGGDGPGGVGPTFPPPPEDGGPEGGGDFGEESSTGQLLTFATQMRESIGALTELDQVLRLAALAGDGITLPSGSSDWTPLHTGAQAIGWVLAHGGEGKTREERDSLRRARFRYEWLVWAHGLATTAPEEELYLEHWFRFSHYFPHESARAQAHDPLDTLALFPLPQTVRQGEAWHSVKDFLFAALSRPELILSGPNGLRASLLIFAASCLTPQSGIWAQSLAEARDSYATSQIDALTWIGAQLPRYAYVRSVEDALADAEEA